MWSLAHVCGAADHIRSIYSTVKGEIFAHPSSSLQKQLYLLLSSKRLFSIRLRPVHVTRIYSHSHCRTKRPVRSAPQYYTAFCFFHLVARVGIYCAAQSLSPPRLSCLAQVCTPEDEPELNQKTEVSPWPYVSRNGGFAKEKIFISEENSPICLLNWKLCYGKPQCRIT